VVIRQEWEALESEH
jgi:hypothetical protein